MLKIFLTGILSGILLCLAIYYFAIFHKVRNNYVKTPKRSTTEIPCEYGLELGKAYLTKMQTLVLAGVNLEEEPAVIQIPRKELYKLINATDNNGDSAAYISGVFASIEGRNSIVLFPSNSEGRRMAYNNKTHEVFPIFRSLNVMEQDTNIGGQMINRYDYYFNCYE